MKKIFSLFAAVLFAGSMFAAEVTLNPAAQDPIAPASSNVGADISLTIEGIGIEYNGSLNAASADGNTPADFRVFGGQNLTLSASENISKVVILGKANKAGWAPTVSSGNITAGASYDAVTTKTDIDDPLFAVEGINAKSITILCNKQLRAYSIIVTTGGEGGGGDVEGDTIDLNFPAKSNVIYVNAVDEEGWWQFQAEDIDYYITLSNGNSITAAAGTYTAAQLDDEYSCIALLNEAKTVTFKKGSVTLVESDDQVSISGILDGSDGNVYRISLVYVEPTNTKDVEIFINGGEIVKDDEESMQTFMISGYSANQDIVNIVIASEQIAGVYSEADIYEDEYTPESIVMTEGQPVWIYSATIKVIALAAEGEYKVEAQLLCYNSVLYKVDMYVHNWPTGIDTLNAAAEKAVKRIVNGQLVIERDGKAFNAIGAQL